MRDLRTGRSKGYGFVSFRTREEAAAAIEAMNDKVTVYEATCAF